MSQEQNLIEPDDALQPARQPHRADRAEGQGAAGRHQARLRPRQGARATAGWRWPTSMPSPPASTARRRSRSSASGAACRGKVAQAENVRAALLLVVARRGAAGIVYQTDAACRTEGEDRRHVPRGHAPADRLSGRADGFVREPGCEGVPRVHAVGQRQACVSKAGLQIRATVMSSHES